MMIMSFYRKSLHSFFSLSPFKSQHQHEHEQQNHHQLLGLGLISNHDIMQIIKSPNVLQSSSLMIKPSSSLVGAPRKVDAGGVGFFDDVGGGGVDGLMSCTESLGFESSDERLVDDELTRMEDGGGGGGCTAVRVRRRRRVAAERSFPPPLTSLNQHGHPNFYLRSVRKDGRLELTEVRIERTEILRACREDGRLRLHLIKDEERKENVAVDKIIEEEEEEEEEVDEGFVKEGKGDQFRRCVEVVNQQRRREHHRAHHHQHLDVWRQHCVTTS